MIKIGMLGCCAFLAIFMGGCAANRVAPPLKESLQPPVGTGESLRPDWEVVYNPTMPLEMTYDQAVYKFEGGGIVDFCVQTYSDNKNYEKKRLSVIGRGDHFDIYDMNNRQYLDIVDKISYYKLINHRIVIEKYNKNANRFCLVLPGGYRTCGSMVDNCAHIYKLLKEQADGLLHIKNTFKAINEKDNASLLAWKSAADEYRLRNVKKGITEDERKLIVQAEALTEQKKYNDAILKYTALLNSTYSYPKAFFNIALLFEALDAPQNAIFNMKVYLMFEPDGDDARNAQDKIYAWELIVSP